MHDGEIDEMLLQAHMVVQFAAILLHFPRSNLILDFCAEPAANDTFVLTTFSAVRPHINCLHHPHDTFMT